MIDKLDIKKVKKFVKIDEIILDATGNSLKACLAIRYCNHIIDFYSKKHFKSGSQYVAQIYKNNLKGENHGC
jgi:hypothetical protein